MTRQTTLTDTATAMCVAFRISRLAEGTRIHSASRSAAMLAVANVRNTDPIGGDLDLVRESATDQLLAQDFRDVAVALFFDDLIIEGLQLAADQRRTVLA